MILGPAIRIFCLTEDEKNHLVLRNIVSALIELVKCLFCFRLMLLQFDRVAAFTKASCGSLPALVGIVYTYCSRTESCSRKLLRIHTLSTWY